MSVKESGECDREHNRGDFIRFFSRFFYIPPNGNPPSDYVLLSTNSRAIRFYEKRHFTRHSFLPLYYAIQGKLKDGFSYVLYLNGGHPPWSLRSSLRSSLTAVASLTPCKISSRLFFRLNQLVWCFIAAIFVGIRKTTTTSFAHGGFHKS